MTETKKHEKKMREPNGSLMRDLLVAEDSPRRVLELGHTEPLWSLEKQ